MSDTAPRRREKASDVINLAPVDAGDAAAAKAEEPTGKRASSQRQRRRPRRPQQRRAKAQVERIMLVHAGERGAQIAVLEEGSIVEHYVAGSRTKSLVGNVYLGRVQNVLPGMEASFVDIGESRNGVL